MVLFLGWMLSLGRSVVNRIYAAVLEREIGHTPDHVAVIQDGNRRFAARRGASPADGHRAGAQTTEAVLQWCKELDIHELTLYAFSTENFSRPAAERENLYDLLCEKLVEFADAGKVHEQSVAIRTLGTVEELPPRVQRAARYAERRTADHDQFKLNIALAYGGRTELLGAARDVVEAVDRGELDPASIEVATIEERLYDATITDVDLIIRTGGDERTSNFLPWHANGNEAAVFFCTPYWPEFSKVDFLRAIRTYEHRERSWERSRRQRAATLVRVLGDVDLSETDRLARRWRPTDRTPGIDRLGRDSDAGRSD